MAEKTTKRRYRTSSTGKKKRIAKELARKAHLLRIALEEELLSQIPSPDNPLLLQYHHVNELLGETSIEEFCSIHARSLSYLLFAGWLNFSEIDRSFFRHLFQIFYHSPLFQKDFLHLFIEKRPPFPWFAILEDTMNWLNQLDKTIFFPDEKLPLKDPSIVFYEYFLHAYDPILRKKRGVWQTPKPAIQFILEAIDEILQKDFSLAKGLDDDEKMDCLLQGQKKQIHRLQVIDPAMGTGAFLLELLDYIRQKHRQNPQYWKKHVEKNILPKMWGFEILRSAYLVAHLKLHLTLENPPQNPLIKPFQLFLKNPLDGFGEELSFRKCRDEQGRGPITIIIGNPPYSVHSDNRSFWIEHLLQSYKKELHERNIQPLSDDYIKFIRYGEQLIEESGRGIMAFITNNSFIDGIIHRKMREHLLKTFDKIYILDLHGNINKEISTPNTLKDENIFEIRQGVSINIFIKNSG